MNSLKNCSDAYKVGVGQGILLRKNFIVFSSLFAVIFLAACGQSRETKGYAEKSKSVAKTVSSYSHNIVTDTINGITHNFIRQADIKCKVKDVLESTKQIDGIVTAAGGYVTKSDLASNKDYSNNVHFKKDSLLETTYYTATSDITFRVPNKRLDSVLLKITNMAVFVDHRVVTSDDVKLKLYANKLAEERLSDYKKHVAKKTDDKRSKLNHAAMAEENILEKQTLSDAESIESHDMIDHVNYSTVILNLYQPQNVYSNIIALSPSIKPFEPSFLNKLGDSFVNGFSIIKNFALFVINFWGLFLILFLLYVVIRRVIKYYSKKSIATV